MSLRRSYARSTGAVYLVYFVSTITGALLVGGGHSIAGRAVALAADLFYVLLVLLLSRLLIPVSRALAGVALVLGLAGSAVTVIGEFHRGPGHFPINPLALFGPFCIVVGLLIARSGFLPRVLGVLIVVAGAGWLAFLVPMLPKLVRFFIEGLGFVAELALMLWLLLAGVAEDRWRARAAANDRDPY